MKIIEIQMKIRGGVIKFNLEKNPTLLCVLDLLRMIVTYFTSGKCYVQKCTLMRFMNCMIDITRSPLTLILTKTHIILSNM